MNCKKSLLCLIILSSIFFGYMIHLGISRHEKYILDKEDVINSCIRSELDQSANINCEKLAKCAARRAMFLFDQDDAEKWRVVNLECLRQMLID